MNLIRTVLFTLCFVLACPLWAQASEPQKKATEEVSKSEEKPANTASPAPPVPEAPAAASFDDKVQREAEDKVRRSEGELGYLGAAYAAAFLILGVFLWSTRKGQQRLADEVHELQARLDEALTSKPGRDA